jgi:hypothetical protein
MELLIAESLRLPTTQDWGIPGLIHEQKTLSGSGLAVFKSGFANEGFEPKRPSPLSTGYYFCHHQVHLLWLCTLTVDRRTGTLKYMY